MVVDDDKALLELLVEILVEDGFITTGFQRGKAALDALSQQRYELLIVDVGLPDINGMRICKAAREQYGDDIVIFIITGDQQRERVMTALEIGADDFIGKPFNTEELLARIEVKLRRRTDIRG
jgi:two-component system catabolic regulation response regulator CreB